MPHDPSAYGEAVAPFYDDWYGEDESVPDVVATVERLAAGGPVLELGIGTGRLAVPLVAAGLEVHGVDASAAMVGRLREKPGGQDVPVVLDDYGRTIPAHPSGWAVVLAAYNAVPNLTTAAEQARCFELVAAALRPGGAFVVEAFVPAPDAPPSGVDVRRVADHEVVLSVFRDDDEGDAVRGSLVSLTPGGVRLCPWAVRPVAPDELDGMATAAGLELALRHAGWREEPFHAGATRHVTVFRRPGGTVGGST